jgi:hypothetical protein
VTEADYAEVTERRADVQRAAATFRWTGSWHTVFVTVDRGGGGPLSGEYEEEIREHVERYRMAGHDLEVDGPQFVSLEIDLHVCVRANISGVTWSVNCSTCSAIAIFPTAVAACFIRTTSRSDSRFISAPSMRRPIR